VPVLGWSATGQLVPTMRGLPVKIDWRSSCRGPQGAISKLDESAKSRIPLDGAAATSSAEMLCCPPLPSDETKGTRDPTQRTAFGWAMARRRSLELLVSVLGGKRARPISINSCGFAIEELKVAPLQRTGRAI